MIIKSPLLFSRSVVSDSLWPYGLQHARLPCPSPSPGACSNSCPLSQWCYPTISSSVIPFSSCSQSFPASGSFLMSQLFASGDQSIGASASALVLLMNIQGWFPLGLTGLISLQSKGLSRVFSSSKASILWHSAFLIIQVSHPYMTPGKTIVLIIWTFVGKVMLYFLICSLGWSLLFFQGASIFSFHGFSHKKIKSVIVSIVSPSVCHEVMELDATIFVLQMLSFKPALPLSSILP